MVEDVIFIEVSSFNLLMDGKWMHPTRSIVIWIIQSCMLDSQAYSVTWCEILGELLMVLVHLM